MIVQPQRFEESLHLLGNIREQLWGEIQASMKDPEVNHPKMACSDCHVCKGLRHVEEALMELWRELGKRIKENN